MKHANVENFNNWHFSAFRAYNTPQLFNSINVKKFATRSIRETK